MSRISERLAKLEEKLASRSPSRRVVRHILDCDPAERDKRISAIESADPDAFHIVRVVITPSETGVAA